MADFVDTVFVVGPTATGKTGLGIALARAFNGEIISADSRQLYRGMDIGTGKDLHDYGIGAEAVPFHLIDILEPSEEYNLFQYIQGARAAIADVSRRGRLPIVVGGTVLYINALLNEYRLEGASPNPGLRNELNSKSDDELLEHLRQHAPDIYQRTDRTQRRRIVRAVEIAVTRGGAPDHSGGVHIRPLLLGPFYDRKIIHSRIEQRLRARLDDGLLAEVEHLHELGVSWERLDYFGLEYRYAAQFLQGQLTYSEFFDTLLARIRRLCKSQEIWFRKMEREGKIIYWIPGGDLAMAVQRVTDFLSHTPLPPPDIRLADRLYGPQTH